ncbi:MAG: hypothetical protein BEN19_01400 [Epulopiscium sp. Nuni2H_MBin003]|nr:MAG: hypothetical protein BEN19_01400 [Epulopiscium sp. Nuni2H_MBin003]
MKHDIIVDISFDKMMATLRFEPIIEENPKEELTENTVDTENPKEELTENDIAENSETLEEDDSADDANNQEEEITLDFVLEKLDEKGVVFGIDNHAIENALFEKKLNKRYLVAKGTKPEKGNNAYIQYHADNTDTKLPKIHECGRVDFKELDFVKSIRPNDIIAVKIEATIGASGFNVLGEEKEGKAGTDIRIKTGKNVRVLEDGLTVVAVTPGQFKLNNDVISIEPVLTIKTDIGVETGNIRFLGNIIIMGSVRDGYKVTSKGDIQINGIVEGGIIEADGNIIVAGGVYGADKGSLTSQKNIIAKFIEHSRVSTEEDVIAEAIVDSEINCKGKIILEQGKGKIIGGVAVAQSGLIAKEVGSPMGHKTEIRIGVEPSMIEVYYQYRRTYREHLLNLDKAVKNITYLEKATQELSEKKKALLAQARILCVNLTNEINSLKERIKSLEVYIQQGRKGTLIANDVLFEGVEISIGNKTRLIKETTISSKCFIHEDEIIIGVV